jgi:hypothetical protein
MGLKYVIKCRWCKEVKETFHFKKRKGRSENSFYLICDECQKDKSKTLYQTIKKSKPFDLKAYAIKAKCTQFNIPYDLDGEYLKNIWNGKCAISGIDLELYSDRRLPIAAEVDRTIPELGYTKGNVAWVSRRMNRLKDNATIKELQLVIDYLKDKLNGK